MADRYMDFDAAVIEDGKPHITFTIGGREYDLPPDLPAKLVLVQMRSVNDEGTIVTSVLADWLEALVGTENLETMYSDCVTWPQMEKLLAFLMDEYGLTNATADDTEAEGAESPN